MLKRSALGAVCVTLLSSVVFAQSAPRTETARPPAPAAAAPGNSAGQNASEVEPPPLPQNDDPLLVPVAAAPRVLAGWQEALALLRTQSTALQGARTRIERAKADVRTARGRGLPTLTGEGRYTNHLLRNEGYNPLAQQSTSLPYPPSFWTGTLTLSVPLSAQTWYDVGTAKDSVRTATLNAKEVERQQTRELAAAIIRVITTERLAEVSRVSLGAALSTLKLNQRRAALGAASAVDVLRVEQEAVASRAQVIDTNEDLLRAREQLGEALFMAEPISVDPNIKLDSLAEDAVRSCSRQTGVELRPDVVAGNAEVDVAKRRVKSVNYAFLPTLEGLSQLFYYSNELSSPNRDHVAWTVGGVIRWNIFDGGLRYADKAARQTDVALAEQRVRDVERRARIEVTQALRAIQVAEAGLAVSQRTRDIAAETARLTRIGYLNGTGTSFDLVDSARRLREAEIDFTLKEFEVVRAKIAAFLALATCNV